MKHLILPIASSPHEGAHQSSIIVDLAAVALAALVEEHQVAAWLFFDGTSEPARLERVITAGPVSA